MTNFDQKVTRQGTTYGTARIKLRHTDLTVASTSQVLTWATLLLTYVRGELLPANATILGGEFNLITEFSGGGSSSAVAIMGDGADPDELLTAIDVFTGAGAGIKNANGALSLPAFEATAYAAQITITSDVNVSLLTAGALEARIIYRASETDSRI